MWTVVYIAPNKKEAERPEKIITEEGFLVKLRVSGLPKTSDSCQWKSLY